MEKFWKMIKSGGQELKHLKLSTVTAFCSEDIK